MPPICFPLPSGGLLRPDLEVISRKTAPVVGGQHSRTSLKKSLSLAVGICEVQ